MTDSYRYIPLIKELIGRDLKIKYRRSFLGYIWSLLNPILMMLILSMVFSYMFRFDIENYSLYLICGQTIWSFFNESTNTAMFSIINNAALIKKVYVPKTIFPVARVFSSFVTMSFSLAAILIVMVITGADFHIEMLLCVIPLALLLVFSVGISLILSALSTFFRDVIHLYSVLTLAWMYLTPIFYPLEAVPEEVGYYIAKNPIYIYLTIFRDLVMNGKLPESEMLVPALLCSAASLIAGIAVFRKFEDRFILYI